jgi:hypothetical protein
MIWETLILKGVYLVDSKEKENGTHNRDATRQGSNGSDLQSFSRRD